MSDSDHPFTPFAAFDSRPKIETAKPIGDPPNPFSEIPRAPRLPSPSSAPRDTDHHELQDAELGDEDQTPSDPESPFEMVLRKLSAVERTSKLTYDLMLEMRTDQQEEKREREQLARRVLALEIRERWVPRLAWLTTTLIALWALLRTYR